MELWDVIRVLNALTASLVFCALCYRGRLYWKTYDTFQRLLWVSFTLYAGGTAYGSVEAYAQNIPGGPRMIPFLIANLVAIYAFLQYRRSAFAK